MRSKIRETLSRVVDTRRKRLLVAVAGSLALAAAILAGLGFWDADSPRYWRRPAQAVLFFAARHSPKSLVAPVTRWALATHVAGTSYEEAEEAASLLEQAGEGGSASVLWLSLVRMDVDSKNYERAVQHATSSHNAARNPDALVALIVLHQNSPEVRPRWISELQANYPNHELSQVFGCLEQLKSFNEALPSPCATVDWVREKAGSGKNEYQRISQQIRELPREAARNIKQNEDSIAALNKEQDEYGRKYEYITSEISRLETEGMMNATGDVIWKLLPLPEKGDTFESYITREGLCLVPVFRLFCAGAALKPYYDLLQRKQRLIKWRELVAEIVVLNRSIISKHRSDIKYWKSSEPLAKLESARAKLLPAFREEAEQNVFGRRPQIGIPAPQAIATVVNPTTGAEGTLTF